MRAASPPSSSSPCSPSRASSWPQTVITGRRAPTTSPAPPAPTRINGRGGNDTHPRPRRATTASTAARGNDTISGDAGNDVIIGGRATTRCSAARATTASAAARARTTSPAGLGNDLVRARDGEVDQRHLRPGPRPRDRRPAGRRRAATARSSSVDDGAGRAGRPARRRSTTRIRRTVGRRPRARGLLRSSPASGGRAALEAAERVHPAVVLLDLNMPDLDGLEVLRRLRDGRRPGAGLRAVGARRGRRPRPRPAGGRRRLHRQAVRDARRSSRALQALLRRRPAGEGEALAGRRPAPRPARPQRATRGERELDLTRREFELLEFLMRHPGEVRRAPAPARGGLGLHLRSGHQRRRRLRRLPAPQARGRRRAAGAAHRARHRLRPAKLRRRAQPPRSPDARGRARPGRRAAGRRARSPPTTSTAPSARRSTTASSARPSCRARPRWRRSTTSCPRTTGAWTPC